MYLDSTALKGDVVSREKMNTYNIVQENSSRSKKPTVLNFKTICINTRLAMTTSTGAIVTTVL